MRDTGFQIEAIYSDEDLLQLRIQGSNGAYGGEAEVYVGLDKIPNMARALRGFPSTAGENLVFELGNFDPKYAGGGVLLQFQCGSTGKVSVEATIENDPKKSTGHFGKVQFTVWIEPAAIDLFIPMLEKIGVDRQGKAILCGLTTG